jgi:hypothetical protein
MRDDITPNQRPFARLTLATMLLVWLLAVSLVFAETAPCSLSDVREGATAAQERERLSPQEFSHVCNTVNATAQGFTPLASRGSILKEGIFTITCMASAEPPLSLVSEKERFLETSVCCVFSGGSLRSRQPRAAKDTQHKIFTARNRTKRGPSASHRGSWPLAWWAAGEQWRASCPRHFSRLSPLDLAASRHVSRPNILY